MTPLSDTPPPVDHSRLTLPNSVDTGLRDSRPCFKLGRGVIAEGPVAALPIIEHLNVFEDVLDRFAPRHVLPLVHELALQCPKEAPTQALSQQVPLRLMLGMRPYASSRR